MLNSKYLRSSLSVLVVLKQLGEKKTKSFKNTCAEGIDAEIADATLLYNETLQT